MLPSSNLKKCMERIAMKIKPVEATSTPKYPDKYNGEIRQVLMSTQPNRWLGTPLATGVLSAALALSLSGCSLGYATDGVPMPSPPAPVEIPSDIDNNFILGAPMPAQILPYDALVPLFEYGEGTGAIGCVSIAAPVFMSEEEAFAVLAAAFSEAGLLLSQDTGTLQNINLPVTNMYEVGGEESSYKTTQGELTPDGLLEYDLPVIFISTKDVESWHKEAGMISSVSTYKVKKTAQILAENNPHLVVFYDPIAGLDYDKLLTLARENGESDEAYYLRRSAVEQEEANAARAESERLLRLQAEAFIAWLADGGPR